MLKSDYKEISTVQDLIDVLKDFDKNKIVMLCGSDNAKFVICDDQLFDEVDLTDLFMN